MITIAIRPCEPHRAFHALLVVSGLNRPPLSARFTIMARHDGKSRYVGPAGWEDKFIECRELAAGWDTEQKVLWLLLGPAVIQLLDRRPFNFTLLQTGEQVTELAMPALILQPGPDGLSPLVGTHEKGVAALLPLPLATPVSAFRASDPARSLKQAADAPGIVTSTAGSDVTSRGKDPSVKPVVLGIGVCLAAVLGVGFLLSGHGGAPTPQVSAVAAPSLVASVQRPLPAPVGSTPDPVAAPGTVAAPAPATVAVAAPATVAVPAPSTVAAPAPMTVAVSVPAPDAMLAPAPVPNPTPTSESDKGGESASSPPSLSLATLTAPVAPAVGAAEATRKAEDRVGGAPPSELPAPEQVDASPATKSTCDVPPGSAANPANLDTASSEAAYCVILGWIESGRTDDAVIALSSLRRSGYVPAMLELAKLYDPLSKHSTPPPAPEFARDEYRRVIQRAGDDPVGREARHRLNALQDG